MDRNSGTRVDEDARTHTRAGRRRHDALAAVVLLLSVVGAGLALFLTASAGASASDSSPTPTAGAPTSASGVAAVTRVVSGATAADDGLLPATVDDSGTTQPREATRWTARRVSGRVAAYQLTYDFGPQVGPVTAPALLPVTYYDAVTHTSVLASLSFVQLQTAGASVREPEREIYVHESWDALTYELAPDLTVRFDAATPFFSGDVPSGAILTLLHYDPAIYTIMDSAWDGTATIDGQATVREASYVVTRRAAAQSALYAGSVPLPDALVYDGVATYRSPSPLQAASRKIVNRLAPDRPSILPWILGATAAAAAALGAVVFWFRRKKRRADAKDEIASTADLEVDDAW